MTISTALVAVKTALWVWGGCSVGVCIANMASGQIGPAVFTAFNTGMLFSCAYVLGLVFNALEELHPRPPEG